ncbi:MAG: sigma factor G inhibitor Gin [Bacillota bacterium]|jgi:hypothetical protein
MDSGKQRCIICGKSAEAGLVILGNLICMECEREIIQTEADEERYALIVRQLKQLWQNPAAAEKR